MKHLKRFESLNNKPTLIKFGKGDYSIFYEYLKSNVDYFPGIQGNISGVFNNLVEEGRYPIAIETKKDGRTYKVLVNLREDSNDWLVYPKNITYPTNIRIIPKEYKKETDLDVFCEIFNLSKDELECELEYLMIDA